MYNKLIKRETKKLDLEEILKLFEKSATEHGTELGLGHDAMLSNNHFWGVLRTKFVLVDNSEVSDVNNITYPKIPGRIDFDREYIISSNDNILVKGISKWILVDVVERKLVRKHNIVFNSLTDDSMFDKLDKIDFDESNFKLKATYNVTSKDLDINNHVNNVSYVNIIKTVCDTLNVIDFQIDYLHEIKDKSIVDVYLYSSDYTYVLGKCNNQNCFIAKIKGE